MHVHENTNGDPLLVSVRLTGVGLWCSHMEMYNFTDITNASLSYTKSLEHRLQNHMQCLYLTPPSIPWVLLRLLALLAVGRQYDAPANAGLRQISPKFVMSWNCCFNSAIELCFEPGAMLDAIDTACSDLTA